MNTPEQFIIGQLYERRARARGIHGVSRSATSAGPGPSAFPPCSTAQLDLYPEYLGEWNSRIAHLHRRFKTLAASYAAGKQVRPSSTASTLLPPTPFSDTSCVAVLSQYAAENHVYSIPELARGPGIIFGSPARISGHPRRPARASRRGYHLHPAYVQPIGVGLQYWWLEHGQHPGRLLHHHGPAADRPQVRAARRPQARLRAWATSCR